MREVLHWGTAWSYIAKQQQYLATRYLVHTRYSVRNLDWLVVLGKQLVNSRLVVLTSHGAMGHEPSDLGDMLMLLDSSARLEDWPLVRKKARSTTRLDRRQFSNSTPATSRYTLGMAY